MGVMHPDGPVMTGMATAVARGIKKGVVPEQPMATRDQEKAARLKRERAEETDEGRPRED